MTTLILNKSFPIFNQKGKSSAKKQGRTIFDQNFSPINKTPNYKTSEYFFDYLSELSSDQSLSQEQIVRSQSKTINEKIDSFSQKYEIFKPEEVKKFLSTNRNLLPLLEELPNKVYEFFGDSQKLSLKVSHEPDFPKSSELWVSILTKLSARVALPLLEKFDEEWWLENMDRANCNININLNFI